MDPALFELDWDRTLQVLAAIVVLAMIVERSLSLPFESRLLISLFRRPAAKELTALALSALVCVYWRFDAVSVILGGKPSPTLVGQIVTAAVVAGGSKGSVKLFRDLLDFKSNAYRRYEEDRRRDADPPAPAA